MFYFFILLLFFIILDCNKSAGIGQIAKDEIAELQNYEDVGWLRVNLEPIKQVLTMYAEKWMWTYTEYLSNQVRV